MQTPSAIGQLLRVWPERQHRRPPQAVRRPRRASRSLGLAALDEGGERDIAQHLATEFGIVSNTAVQRLDQDARFSQFFHQSHRLQAEGQGHAGFVAVAADDEGHGGLLLGLECCRQPDWRACSQLWLGRPYGLCAMARWSRPRASGEAISANTLCVPADWPNTVTCCGSPPKAAIFCCTVLKRQAARPEDQRAAMQPDRHRPQGGGSDSVIRKIPLNPCNNG